MDGFCYVKENLSKMHEWIHSAQVELPDTEEQKNKCLKLCEKLDKWKERMEKQGYSSAEVFLTFFTEMIAQVQLQEEEAAEGNKPVAHA